MSHGLPASPLPPTTTLESVLPVVYDDLRKLAEKTLGTRSRSLTLQPTALVHEAYLRLRRERNGWSSRGHFMVAAAVAMRRALLDHLRARESAKRGGGRRTSVNVATLAIDDHQFEALMLEDALRQLETENPDAAQVAELRIYGGLSGNECAEALGVSTKTIQRRWRFARAWLITTLNESSDR